MKIAIIRGHSLNKFEMQSYEPSAKYFHIVYGFFTIMTMDYFTEESAFKYYSHARFKILRKELKFEPKWLQWLFNLRPEFTERLLGIVPVKANIYWVLKKSAANGDV